MMNKLKLSTLPHTWIFDVDGTIVKHNGYKTDGFDTLLEGVHNLFLNIPQEDKIILLTGRNNSCRSNLELFLKQHNLRYKIRPSACVSGVMCYVNSITFSVLLNGKVVNRYPSNLIPKYVNERGIVFC